MAYALLIYRLCAGDKGNKPVYEKSSRIMLSKCTDLRLSSISFDVNQVDVLHDVPAAVP